MSGRPSGWKKSLRLILTALCLTMMLPVAESFAGGGGGAGGGAYGGVQSRCQQILQQVKGADKDGAFIVEYVVTCTKTVVEEVFQQMIDGFYPLVEMAIGASLTLAVVFFGLLLMTGSIDKSSRDTFIALFKVGCVLYFVQPAIVSEIYHMGLDSMDGLTDLVFQFGKGSGANGKCFDNDTVWDRMDCMLDVLIGTVKAGGAGGGAAAAGAMQGIARGTIPMAMTYLASTGVGALIGLINMYVIVTILFAALKSIHTYLAAIIALSFVLIFAPLFVPMIMFKVTRGYFDRWQRIATSFVLQPVILFAFLSLMLIALEDMLIDNNGSFLKMTCGQECTQKDKFPMKVLSDNGAVKASGKNSAFSLGDDAYQTFGQNQDAGAFGKGTLEKMSSRTASTKPVTDSVSYGQPIDQVDMQKAAGLSGSGDETRHQERAGLAAITLALTAFVFLSMLNYIPTLATELSGGLYEAPNLYNEMGKHLPGGEQANKMIGGFTDKFKQTTGLMGTGRDI